MSERVRESKKEWLKEGVEEMKTRGIYMLESTTKWVMNWVRKWRSERKKCCGVCEKFEGDRGYVSKRVRYKKRKKISEGKGGAQEEEWRTIILSLNLCSCPKFRNWNLQI